MKILTLWQPWASLMAAGVKSVETRSWGTPYRGPVAIHAARKWDEETAQAIESAREDLKKCWGLGFLEDGCQRYLRKISWQDTLGRVLCVAELTDCREMPEAPDPVEGLFGSYGPGRWGWVFDRRTLRPLREPVPCRGQRGLLDLPADALAAVRAQLA